MAEPVQIYEVGRVGVAPFVAPEESPKAHRVSADAAPRGTNSWLLFAMTLGVMTLALTQYNGRNNGDIALTRSALQEYGYTSADTLNRALKQLRHAGLLELTRQGGLANGGKIPNLYAVTWLPIPENTKLEIRTPAKASDAWATFKTTPNTALPERVRSDP